MDNNEVYEKLKEIKIENYIWIIYIGIIFLSWYSNSLEKDYYVNNNLKSKNKYRDTLVLIFSILIIIYFYFLNSSYNDLKNINNNTTDKKKRLIYLSFSASLLIFISGLIYLYIALTDENIDVELAFN